MIKNGYIDWAHLVPGVPDKTYSAPNQGIGIIGHSIVGEERDFEDGIPNRFLSRERYWDVMFGGYRYTADAAGSCMFVLRKSGLLIQMHPVTASTWTSGTAYANTHFWPVELEGGGYGDLSEPMTDEQLATMLRLAAEWEMYTGLDFTRERFHQHNEVYATACPSGRYERFIETLLTEDEMATVQEQLNGLKILLLAGAERGEMSDADRLAIADDLIARGRDIQSVRDVAYSAIAVAMKTASTGSGEEDGLSKKEREELAALLTQR